jgi:hypothetical protein
METLKIVGKKLAPAEQKMITGGDDNGCYQHCRMSAACSDNLPWCEPYP